MKKTLLVFIVFLITLSVFFCGSFSAYAAPISFYEYRQSFLNQNGVTAFVAAQCLYPDVEQSVQGTNPTTEYTYGTWSMLLTYSLASQATNSMNKDINQVYITLNFNLPSSGSQPWLTSPVSIDNQSLDLYIAKDTSNSQFTVFPSSDWTHSGAICIPIGQRLTGVAEIEFPVIYSPQNGMTWATLSTITISVGVNTDTNYIPNGSHQDINNYLEDIYGALQSNNGSAVSNDSNTLHDQSEAVHNQEATYYAQNSQAIQDTGLSNYQFDNSTVSGLQGVRGDFIDVWNSLGGWTSIYIFSLTLGLALTILRHSPSAISSAIRRRKQNNE